MKMYILKMIKIRGIRYGIVPAVFLLFGIGMSMLNILTSDYSITTLSYKHTAPLKSIKTTEIRANEIIPIHFTAQEDYLGVIDLPFNTYKRKNNDTLVFRIKKKGEKSWYYENSFDISKFGWGIVHYPFGFPVIEKSKGENFIIELTSRRGKDGNGIGVSESERYMVSKYSIPKALITANISSALTFIQKKVAFAFSFEEFVYSTVLYHFPLLGYLLLLTWLDFIRKYITQKMRLNIEKYLTSFPFILFMTALYLDVVFVHSQNNIFIVSLIIIWIIIIRYFKFSSTYSYIAGFTLLISGVLLKQIEFEEFARHAFNWSFILLTIALFMDLGKFKTSFSTK